MNRKQRKARLKRLNAVKKEHNKIPLTAGFKDKVAEAKDHELQRMLDELYLVFTWESDRAKIRQRIDWIENEMKHRKLREIWPKKKRRLVPGAKYRR